MASITLNTHWCVALLIPPRFLPNCSPAVTESAILLFMYPLQTSRTVCSRQVRAQRVQTSGRRVIFCLPFSLRE